MPQAIGHDLDVERAVAPVDARRRHAHVALAQPFGLGLPAGALGEGGGVDDERLEEHGPTVPCRLCERGRSRRPDRSTAGPVVLGERPVPDAGAG